MGPATVYYGDQAVSASSNDGSLDAGAAITLTQGKWFVSAASTRINVSRSITAETGPPGPPGDEGPQGPLGVVGPIGPAGVQGVAGAQGPQGLTGAASTVPGPTGAPGSDGTDGAQGVPGTPGAQGVQGLPGNIGLPGADSTVPGPQGLPGDAGVQGPPGNTGPPGNAGSQGIQGIPGNTGPPGPAEYTRVKKTADTANSTLVFSTDPHLTFPLLALTDYEFAFDVAFMSAALTTGLQLAVTGPGSNLFAAEIVVPISKTASVQARVRAYDDPALGTGVDAINANLLATIRGLIRVGATGGNLAVRFRSEINASAVTLKQGSIGRLRAV